MSDPAVAVDRAAVPAATAADEATAKELRPTSAALLRAADLRQAADRAGAVPEVAAGWTSVSSARRTTWPSIRA